MKKFIFLSGLKNRYNSSNSYSFSRCLANNQSNLNFKKIFWIHYNTLDISRKNRFSKTHKWIQTPLKVQILLAIEAPLHWFQKLFPFTLISFYLLIYTVIARNGINDHFNYTVKFYFPSLFTYPYTDIHIHSYIYNTLLTKRTFRSHI